MTEVLVQNSDTNAEQIYIDGVDYYRYDGSDKDSLDIETVRTGQFHKFVIKADRVLSDDEMEKVMQIAGYFWKTKVRATEPLTSGVVVKPDTIVYHQGLYESGSNHVLSASNNPSRRFAEFVTYLDEVMHEGTTLRTDDTRLVDGLATPTFFTVYVDEVEAYRVLDDNVAFSASAFEDKEAEELTFTDVKRLLALFREGSKTVQTLQSENAELKGKLETIKAVLQ